MTNSVVALIGKRKSPESYDALGSGTLVNYKSNIYVVVTNHQVNQFSSYSKVHVYRPDKADLLEIEIVSQSSKSDLALLKFKDVIDDLDAISFESVDRDRIFTFDTEVTVYGFPNPMKRYEKVLDDLLKNLKLTANKHKMIGISYVLDSGDKSNSHLTIDTDLKIFNGQSGGLSIHDDGNYVGINRGFLLGEFKGGTIKGGTFKRGTIRGKITPIWELQIFLKETLL